MAFTQTSIVLDGTTYNSTIVSKRKVAGSLKMYIGRWIKVPIPGRSKNTNISVSGFLVSDAQKNSLQNLENDDWHSYADGADTFAKVVVLSLSVSVSTGPEKYEFDIELEEYDQ